jgi:hypothetical protein
MNCKLCNGKTVICDEDWEYGEYCDTVSPISLFEDNEVWHVCLTCDCWQLTCPNCKYQCRFVGYSGCHKNSTHLRIPSIDNIDKKYIKEIKEEFYYAPKDTDINYYLKHGGSVLCTPYDRQEELKIEILDEESTKKFLEDFPERKDFPHHYVGDKDQFYAINKYDGSCCITGPDGGFPHYWKCDQCSKLYSFTDK